MQAKKRRRARCAVPAVQFEPVCLRTGTKSSACRQKKSRLAVKRNRHKHAVRLTRAGRYKPPHLRTATAAKAGGSGGSGSKGRWSEGRGSESGSGSGWSDSEVSDGETGASTNDSIMLRLGLAMLSSLPAVAAACCLEHAYFSRSQSCWQIQISVPVQDRAEQPVSCGSSMLPRACLFFTQPVLLADTDVYACARLS
eukprot:86829-Pelagomonas_calceolata.AAC.1